MSNLINKVFGYFDLGSEIRTKYDRGQTGRGGNNNIHYFLQYLALVMGIFVQPFLEKFRQTGQWNFEGFWGWILFAIIVGLIIFPAVYKTAFDAKNPRIIQLCSIFGMGMGWESLISTAKGFSI